MFENICTFPLSSELFSQATHPTEPLVAVGLSAGHVETLRLPGVGNDGNSQDRDGVESGCSTFKTIWRTRRHKGSCRSLAWSFNGNSLYSVGTDSIFKAAETATGRVTFKFAIPLTESRERDTPAIVRCIAPNTLLLGTDSATLYLYDLRETHTLSSSKPQSTFRPHDDYVSSIAVLPPSNDSHIGTSKQFVTTGGTTLAVTDIRKGVISRSEDQEEELLSCAFVSGLPFRGGSGKGEKVVVGGAGGILTLWPRGQWDDQDERITVDRDKGGGESLDCLAVLPEGTRHGGSTVAVGLGDGKIKCVKLGVNKVIAELKHDEVESVLGLDFDIGGRLISGGGSVVKVWTEEMQTNEETTAKKRPAENKSDDEESDVSGRSDSDEEPKERKKRKKRKRAKGKAQVNSKSVLAFNGLD